MAIVHGNDSSETHQSARRRHEQCRQNLRIRRSGHIYGFDGDDEIYGGEGDDWIYGHGDNDVLKGGGGADHLWGGER